MTSLPAPGLKGSAASMGPATLPETMRPRSFALFWLIGLRHDAFI
ncbi:MAG: hypothetical protein G01um101419_848 [Parcubacteria group bacterium Gr01-1014_19]|nr:MAG: hypothetical protein G01um101419_848 [Parcubacteria group bacterium Gr01-1014_19]